MQCPSCSASLPGDATECASCGVVLAKWKPRGAGSPRSAPASIVKPSAAPKPPLLRLLRIAVLSVAGAAVVVGGWWMIRARSWTSMNKIIPAREKKLAEALTPAGDYEAARTLPGVPLGMVSDGTSLLVGNRNAPGGIFRVRRDGGDLRALHIPVIEAIYKQELSVDTIGFDGEHVVGYTTGSWFGLTGDVFTIHDPKTLAIIDKVGAPPLLGGLAFDGKQWWAATRRNTEDSGEPAFLYRLNRKFEVIAKTEAPAVGCQGLAWDGRHLWFVDVFSDEILVLDVATDPPQIVSRHEAPFSYLSGIAAFEGDLWISEYGDNRIMRIKPSVRTAWAGGRAPVAKLASAMAPDIAALTEKLKSGDVFERIEAEAKLDQANASILFDRETNRAMREPEEAELIEWSAEVRDGSVYGSWRLWFGEGLFTDHEPSQQMLVIPRFAKYTVTFDPPGEARFEKEFDATRGENTMTDIYLGRATDSGAYAIELFMHVQYVAADGTQKILNRSFVPLELRIGGAQ